MAPKLCYFDFQNGDEVNVDNDDDDDDDPFNEADDFNSFVQQNLSNQNELSKFSQVKQKPIYGVV